MFASICFDFMYMNGYVFDLTYTGKFSVLIIILRTIDLSKSSIEWMCFLRICMFISYIFSDFMSEFALSFV